MSEASKVRLVRCPKCENLLQEPPDISVYQCGGCGTVLRAKKRGPLDNGDLDVYDEEQTGGVLDKVDDSPAALVDDFREEQANEGFEHGEAIGKSDLNGSSNSNKQSVPENWGAASNGDIATRLPKRIGPRPDQNRKIGPLNDGFEHSEVPNVSWIRDSGTSSFNIHRAAYTGSRFETEDQEFMPMEASLRSRRNLNPRNMDKSHLVSSLSSKNDVALKKGFANSSYPDQGPSGDGIFSYGTYMEQAKYEDRLARVEVLENDRAELLRKLDELAEQLTSSCNVGDEPRETRFRNGRTPPASTNSYDTNGSFKQPGTSLSYGLSKQPFVTQPGTSMPYGVSKQPSIKPPGISMSYGARKQPIVTDQPVLGHSYVPQTLGYASYMDRHGSNSLEPYPPRNHMQEYGRYGTAHHPQMLRRPTDQPPNKYFYESRYEHFPAHGTDFKQDLFIPEPHETFHDKPACSCMHHFNNNIYAPRKFQPSVLSSQNDRNNYTNHMPYCHVNPVAYAQQGYVSDESTVPQLHSHDRNPLTRSSSDLGVETNGFGRRRLKKPVVSHRDRRVLYPIAGGAPFITCCNCSEVLKISRKLVPVQEKQTKMKCGACSSVLLFEFEKEGIVLSVPGETEPMFVATSDATHVIHGQKFQQPYGLSNKGATDTFEEYGNLNCDSILTDIEPNAGLGVHLSNSDINEMGQDPHSFSSMTSEDEPSPDSMTVRKNSFHSPEMISKDEASSCLPDSPCDKYLDQPSSDSLMDRRGQGSESKSFDHEKIFPDGKTSRQNSLKDALVATEMDVSYDDNSTNAAYHYTSDATRDNDQPRINKGAESFFKGLIKKSFGDFSRSTKNAENGRSNVSVNGRFISDRLVKKAEKFAGPIQPGDYWYDYRAGFWGVMGHPCLGIIMPSIDEFNYPMPENCAGGNTEVFLNGRELHQKDLDLLASRGLPTTRHKSYLIEISGRVVDEDTGEEYDLGKLAPTVEREKHGFGMKVPKSMPKQ